MKTQAEIEQRIQEIDKHINDLKEELKGHLPLRDQYIKEDLQTVLAAEREVLKWVLNIK